MKRNLLFLFLLSLCYSVHALPDSTGLKSLLSDYDEFMLIVKSEDTLTENQCADAYYLLEKLYEAAHIQLAEKGLLELEKVLQNSKKESALKIDVTRFQSKHLLSIIYVQMGQYEIALDYEYNSLQVAYDIEYTRGIGESFIGLGTIYRNMGDFDQAHVLLDSALFSSQANEYILFWAHYHKGYTYYLERKKDSANEQYALAINLPENDKVSDLHYLIYNLLGDLNVDYDIGQAQKYYRKSLRLNKERAHEQFCHSNYGLAMVALKRNNLNLAKNKLNEVFHIADKYDFGKHKINCLEKLVYIATREKNFNLASQYSKSLTMEYRIMYEDKKGFLAVEENKRIIEQVNKELEVLTRNNEIASFKIRQRNILIIVFALLIVVFIGVLLFYKGLLAEREKVNLELTGMTAQLSKSNERLKRLQEKLVHSNDNLKDFATAVSHDLKSPLSTVKLYADMLLRSGNEINNRKAHGFLRSISSGSKKMEIMINQLLIFSQVDRQVKRKQVALATILKSVISQLENEMAKNYSIVQYSENLPTLYCNESLISQLFLNLINNAIKYAKLSSLPQISIYVDGKKSSANFCCIAVQDNGVGIPKENQHEIFNLFVTSEEGDVNSQGVGLNTCKKIAAAHSGKIWVESIEGEGATFFVLLPVYVV